MSNLIVEGFGTYGVGQAESDQPVGLAMLAGAWASHEFDFTNDPEIGTLPWDVSNPDTYFSTVSHWGGNTFREGPRRVLPSATSTVIFSFYYATAQLTTQGVVPILVVHDSDGAPMAVLGVTSTGALGIYDGHSTAIGSLLKLTSGPVIVAEATTHIELKINCTDGDVELWASGQKVLDESGLVFSNTGDIAQFSILGTGNGTSEFRHYMSHLIVRDTSGSVNNDIVGDRKVATLFPNQDVIEEQGWTPRPLQRFGVGILDLSSPTSWVAGEISSDTDIGANDFTIEGQFRFKELPTGSNKAVLFGKWDENFDQRSYQLYLGGPDLENGVLTFRTSTDGTNGTVVNKLQWKWEPVTGRWYHIALVRSSGELLLFIDGVQQGVPVVDSDTYFAGTAVPAIGAQTNASSGVDGNYFVGWQDEFRLTIGAARYTANFSPPTDAFPRSGNDPDWGSVKWLSSWDNDAVADDGPLSLSVSPRNGAAAVTPNDGRDAYETIEQRTPFDDTFIEAELVAAQGIFTLTALPEDGETVTVGTTDGVTPAVYTFVETLSTAFDVLIGADISETMENLAAAINGGDGEGVVYGTGTTINADVTAEVQPTGQLVVTAVRPGTGGNSIATSDTCNNGSWGDSTLSGGVDIPGPSQFRFERMPPNTTIVDSVTLVARQWRNQAGTASTKVSFVGADGGKLDGDTNVLGNAPTLTFDTFEADPDGGNLSPTSVLLGKFQIDRTA